MPNVSAIVAHRPAGQSKWNYVMICLNNDYLIERALLFLLIRRGEVEKAVSYNTCYWHITDMITRWYTFYSPNQSAPLTRSELRRRAARKKWGTIYWIAPGGQLWETRQRLSMLYFAENAEGRCELRNFTGLFNNRVEYKTMAVLTEQQEQELETDIREHYLGKTRYDISPELKEKLVAAGIIGFEDMFEFFPVERVSDNTEFTVTYNPDYLKKRRSRKAKEIILPKSKNTSLREEK